MARNGLEVLGYIQSLSEIQLLANPALKEILGECLGLSAFETGQISVSDLQKRLNKSIKDGFTDKDFLEKFELASKDKRRFDFAMSPELLSTISKSESYRVMPPINAIREAMQNMAFNVEGMEPMCVAANYHEIYDGIMSSVNGNERAARLSALESQAERFIEAFPSFATAEDYLNYKPAKLSAFKKKNYTDIALGLIANAEKIYAGRPDFADIMDKFVVGLDEKSIKENPNILHIKSQELNSITNAFGYYYSRDIVKHAQEHGHEIDDIKKRDVVQEVVNEKALATADVNKEEKGMFQKLSGTFLKSMGTAAALQLVSTTADGILPGAGQVATLGFAGAMTAVAAVNIYKNKVKECEKNGRQMDCMDKVEVALGAGLTALPLAASILLNASPLARAAVLPAKELIMAVTKAKGAANREGKGFGFMDTLKTIVKKETLLKMATAATGSLIGIAGAQTAATGTSFLDNLGLGNLEVGNSFASMEITTEEVNGAAHNLDTNNKLMESAVGVQSETVVDYLAQQEEQTLNQPLFKEPQPEQQAPQMTEAEQLAMKKDASIRELVENSNGNLRFSKDGWVFDKSGYKMVPLSYDADGNARIDYENGKFGGTSDREFMSNKEAADKGIKFGGKHGGQVEVAPKVVQVAPSPAPEPAEPAGVKGWLKENMNIDVDKNMANENLRNKAIYEANITEMDRWSDPDGYENKVAEAVEKYKQAHPEVQKSTTSEVKPAQEPAKPHRRVIITELER